MAMDDLYEDKTAENPREDSSEETEGHARLSRIYARVNGKTVSLKDMTNEQFGAWYGNYLLDQVKHVGCGHEMCARFAMLSILDELDLPPIELKDV